VRRYGSGVNVVAGPSLNDVTLKAQLGSAVDRGILHIENLEPHSFAGFRNSQVRVGLVSTGCACMLLQLDLDKSAFMQQHACTLVSCHV
jgi:hypothetical protein